MLLQLHAAAGKVLIQLTAGGCKTMFANPNTALITIPAQQYYQHHQNNSQQEDYDQPQHDRSPQIQMSRSGAEKPSISEPTSSGVLPV